MAVQQTRRSLLADAFQIQRFAADDTGLAVLRAGTWIGLLLLPTLLFVVGTGSTELFVLGALVGFIVWLRRHRNGLPPLGPEQRIAAVDCLVLTATVLLQVVKQGAAYPAVRELDTLLRPLLAIPLMHLMLRTRPPVGILWGAMALAAIAAGLYGIGVQLTADAYVRVRVLVGLGPIQYGTIALTAGFITLLGLRAAGNWRTTFLVPALLALARLPGPFRRQTYSTASTRPLPRWSATSMIPPATAARRSGSASRCGGRVGRFLEHPVSGGGIGKAFNERVRAGVAAGRYHPAISNQDKLHNASLEVLAARGLIGLAGLLAFLGGSPGSTGAPCSPAM